MLNKEEIGMNKFKFYRKQIKASQEQLSKRLGVDQTTVGKWELGKAFPRPSTLKKLSQIYECSIDDLYDEPEKEEAE